MATQQPSEVEFNGRSMTYERFRFEQTKRQEAVIRQVDTLVKNEGAKLAQVAQSFGQQEYGGFLRAVVPNLIDKYGQVNATAAVDFYQDTRTAWFTGKSRSSNREIRKGQSRRADRFASAVTQGQLATASGYRAQFADDYKLAEKSDRVINWAMKVRQESGHEPSVSAMNNALTREVAMFHRDTVLFNSALDPFVSKVQRVAQASACEFCRLMALGSTRGTVRTTDYAAKFHDNCHCTIQPLYDGEEPIRPDYYDDFEKQYESATRDGANAQSVLRNWRKDIAGTNRPSSVPLPRVSTDNFASSVANAKTNADIQGLLEAKHGSRVKFSGLDRRDLKIESIREVATTLDKLMDEFPDTMLRNVKVAPTGKAFAWVRSYKDPATGLRISDIEMGPGNLKNPSKLREAIERSTSAGHFREMKSGDWEEILTHEFGHVVDNSLNKAFSPIAVRDAFLEERVGRAVSREANDLLNEQVSRYARTNRHELIAEAFADARIGKNPSELNVRIYEGLLDAYRSARAQ